MTSFTLEELKDPLGLEIIRGVGKVFKGPSERWEPLLLGLLGTLHVLMEDLPGVGKTTLAKALAGVLGLDFGRIQFTPDLLPGDVVGTTVWSLEKKDFFFRPGAIMHQFILADEINRASARTQSALLEAMQEGQVTVDGVSHRLPEPFFVAATQNPGTFQGTFTLPEAQIDRFGLVFSLGYPTSQEAMEIIDLPLDHRQIELPVLDEGPVRVQEARRKVQEVQCRDSLKNWAVSLAERSRMEKRIALGISPRGLQHWLRASKASAYLRGRDFVIPEDLLNTLNWTLCHRLVLTSQARMEGEKPQDILASLVSARALPLK